MVIHELKTLPRHFTAQESGKKRFELRKDDRPVRFRAGHHLHLREWTEEEGYSGSLLILEVTHVTREADGLAEGYVIMSTTPADHISVRP